MNSRNCRNTAALVLATLLSVIMSCCADCPMNFLRLHNKCYYFSTDKVPWIDAYFRCKEIKSNLLILSSKNQDNRLRHYLQKEYLVPSEWWVGANFDWKKGIWRWSKSGRPIKYNQFVQKNKKKLQWNCATVDYTLDYKWGSRKCTESLHYICETKQDANATIETLDNDIPIISPYDKNLILQNDNNEPGFISRPVSTKSKPDLSKPKMICPKGYRHVKGLCYRFSKETATWQDAYYICDAEYNGTLAIVRNKKEDTAIRRAGTRLGLRNFERWIGGRYDWEDMAWKWATNGAVIQHQTNDRDRLRWHCLVWNPQINDKWTSDNCVKKKHYICQTKGRLVRFPQGWKNRPVSQLTKKLNPIEYQLELRYNRSRWNY